MTLRHIQTCEQCGTTRELKKNDGPDVGGWRTLNSGNQAATFCNDCVRTIVQTALAAADDRQADA